MSVIEAEGFILRDRAGRHRAMLGTSSDGTVFLELCDKLDNTRVALRVGLDGTPEFRLMTASGRTLVELKVVGEDVAGFVLGHELLEASASLTVTPGFVHLSLGSDADKAINLSLISDIANVSICNNHAAGITMDVFPNGETMVHGFEAAPAPIS